MDETQQTIAAMRAVTISREYGSGGGEIAARLAGLLKWRLVDHEIIAHVAHELEVPETVVAARDEYAEGTFSRILNSIWRPTAEASAPTIGEAPSFTSSRPIVRELPYEETVRQVIKASANAGHVVIVGRGGQVLLADQRDVLHVRVVAPLEQRIAYVARREGLSTDAARTRIQIKDRDRTRYMQTQYRCQHDDPRLYDLVINTSVLALDNVVNLISQALEYKASRLSVPLAELGPVTGMTRYTAKAADFPVPPQPSA